jgi:hypothetical protein
MIGDCISLAPLVEHDRAHMRADFLTPTPYPPHRLSSPVSAASPNFNFVGDGMMPCLRVTNGVTMPIWLLVTLSKSG